jgi:UDP-glucose 4-epimerase
VRTLVTGGAGFIGSNLVDALIGRGDSVLVIDDLSKGSEANLAAAISAGAELLVADIAERSEVGPAISAFDPDVILHLAAQADVRRALADPLLDARINVLGTISALEAARETGSAFVFAATGGAVYGEGEGRGPLPFTEDAHPAPETAYGVSKLAGEFYVDMYRRVHSVPALALRFANVYGPRQDPNGEAGVVAIFCGRLLAGAAPTIYGDGLQTRDYVFVHDVVEALVAAADRLVGSGRDLAGPLNIGTGVEASVLELVERLALIAGRSFAPEFAPARAGEVQRVAIDPGAAKGALGWTPRTDLEAGLAATLESVRESP